jgi:hypothetical protein
MNVEYALIGLLAAVPIAVILVVLALRGYDVTLLLKRRKKDDE